MTFEAAGLACVRGERLVFEHLDFTLGPGGALLLEGPNGSGKSSLLRLCAGLLAPAEGRLAWDQAAIGEDPEAHRERLQFVGHLDGVKPVFTVVENLGFWAGLCGAAPATVLDALERVGLGHLAGLPARFLSAGQRRRLNLARLLLGTATPLWLLDEPTSALDRAGAEMLAGVIEQHRTGGGMVIAATHLDLGLEAPQRLDLRDYAAAA